jgi:two-component system cell cycle response regulator
MGLEVDHYESGEGALEAFWKRDYDVVITDVVLEGEMSGLNVVRGIRSAPTEKREIPVLAVSGHEDMSRRVEILRSGANDYIEKPVVEDEFKARLGNLITSKQLLDQVRTQQDELRKLAVTDQLTGLYNRTYLAETAQKYVSSAIRHQESLSLLMLDLDKFKDINDTHGHAMGDTVLAAIGRMLTSRCREEDVVARFGGEEFIVLLPRCDLDNAIYKAEHLCQFVRELQPEGMMVSASFGVSSIHQGGRHIDFEKLLKEADTALYAAKGNGRDRVEVFSPEECLEASA